jgi:hypothetical protein
MQLSKPVELLGTREDNAFVVIILGCTCSTPSDTLFESYAPMGLHMLCKNYN